MPEVSVILPVYNGEAYLKEAIDSILAQTFTDFELIIVDDGSQDRSAAIVASYRDPRIRYVRNEQNKGLIFSLNRAIDMAEGQFIARMDADDISLPERLNTQISYLKNNGNIGILASTIIFINQHGIETGSWKLDRKTISQKQIRRAMPRENCIAHPTVMGRKRLFNDYRYNENQKNIEDYDLWLRMLNANIQFEKVPEPLLLYRVHQESVTQGNRANILPTRRVFQCKKKYLSKEFSKFHFSIFNLRLAFFALVDLATIFKKKFF